MRVPVSLQAALIVLAAAGPSPQALAEGEAPAGNGGAPAAAAEEPSAPARFLLYIEEITGERIFIREDAVYRYLSDPGRLESSLRERVERLPTRFLDRLRRSLEGRMPLVAREAGTDCVFDSADSRRIAHEETAKDTQEILLTAARDTVNAELKSLDGLDAGLYLLTVLTDDLRSRDDWETAVKILSMPEVQAGAALGYGVVLLSLDQAKLKLDRTFIRGEHGSFGGALRTEDFGFGRGLPTEFTGQLDSRLVLGSFWASLSTGGTWHSAEGTGEVRVRLSMGEDLRPRLRLSDAVSLSSTADALYTARITRDGVVHRVDSSAGIGLVYGPDHPVVRRMSVLLQMQRQDVVGGETGRLPEDRPIPMFGVRIRIDGG